MRVLGVCLEFLSITFLFQLLCLYFAEMIFFLILLKFSLKMQYSASRMLTAKGSELYVRNYALQSGAHFPSSTCSSIDRQN